MVCLPVRMAVVLALAAFLPAWPCAAQDDSEVADGSQAFPKLGLTLTLPEELRDFDHRRDLSEQLLGSWAGKLDSSVVRIDLYALPIKQFLFVEPEDVIELIADNVRRGRRGDGVHLQFKFDSTELFRGPYGAAPYACLGVAKRQEPGSTRDAKTLYVMTGLTSEYGYSVEVECEPVPDEDMAALLLSFLEDGIEYDGPLRNPEWDDEEAESRWEQHAPESARGREFRDPLRTEHYIILTNSSGGKSFGKKMEANYKRIRKLYPFPDREGTKLMPVFLFRTNEQYYEFCQSVAGWSKQQAMNSKGHAWKDYYATWYESPNDPVHIHEATHQIFSNRLHLNGGGSWFQEGVAEYIETKANERNNAARLVEKGEHLPLRELMQLRSLLQSAATSKRFGNQAGNNYKLAALLVEFLCESKWGREKFQEYLHTVGKVPRSDLESIELALQRVYGVGIDELEEKWIAYCKKR